MPDFANLRRRVHVMLDPSARIGNGLSSLNRFFVLLIVVSVAVAILGSEPTIYRGHERLFIWIETGITIVFLIEYSLRLWTCVENPLYASRLKGRIAYALTPIAVLDLLTLTPLLFTIAGSEIFLLRLARMLRILRLTKLGRYSIAMSTIWYALRSRRYELTMSICIACAMLLLSSTLLYIVESGAQPDSFGSIPRAMWWSIATLTTVGYGDVFPVTVIGRILAGATAIIGIGLIAMPTGILAASFSDALATRRSKSTEDRDGT